MRRPAFGFTRGFTRQESMVVLGIFVAVFGIFYLNLIEAKAKARDQQRKSDVKRVALALDTYFNEYDQYPEENGGRVVGCGRPKYEGRCEWGIGDFGDEDGTVYLERVPADPLFQRSRYVYRVNKELNRYQVFTALERTGDAEIVSGLTAECSIKPNVSLKCNFGVGGGETTMYDDLE